MKLPDPTKLVVTIGVNEMLKDLGKQPFLLEAKVLEFYAIQPDQNIDGGNDKFFFSMKFFGVKLFAAENEIGGLTIMLPEEY